MTEEIDCKNLSLEEFNKLIDESEEQSCSFCFSLGAFKHLDEAGRKLAYLGYSGKEAERVKFLASEFVRLQYHAVDDQVYFLITNAELLVTDDIESLTTIQEHIVLRADEMVRKKMPAAWVAVRAYAWIKGCNREYLLDFMKLTDDLMVWQVVLQCMSAHMLSWGDLLRFRDEIYKYTLKAIELGDAVKPMVVAGNGIQALMRFSDERALELFHKLPRSVMHRQISDEAERLIAKLTKDRMTQYIPVLMELKQLCEKPAPLDKAAIKG